MYFFGIIFLAKNIGNILAKNKLGTIFGLVSRENIFGTTFYKHYDLPPLQGYLLHQQHYQDQDFKISRQDSGGDGWDQREG